MADCRPDAPGGMFTPDDTVETLWSKTYQAEMLGEILFAGVAARLTNGEHAHKMRVLSTMACHTKEAVIPSLERAGIPTEVDPETVASAEALAEWLVAAMDWLDFMRSFEPMTTQHAVMYARIGELDPSEKAMSDLLVAQQLAVAEFARREIAGSTEDSLDPIAALPYMHAP